MTKWSASTHSGLQHKTATTMGQAQTRSASSQSSISNLWRKSPRWLMGDHQESTKSGKRKNTNTQTKWLSIAVTIYRATASPTCQAVTPRESRECQGHSKTLWLLLIDAQPCSRMKVKFWARTASKKCSAQKKRNWQRSHRTSKPQLQMQRKQFKKIRSRVASLSLKVVSRASACQARATSMPHRDLASINGEHRSQTDKISSLKRKESELIKQLIQIFLIERTFISTDCTERLLISSVEKEIKLRKWSKTNRLNYN